MYREPEAKVPLQLGEYLYDICNNQHTLPERRQNLAMRGIKIIKLFSYVNINKIDEIL